MALGCGKKKSRNVELRLSGGQSSRRWVGGQGWAGGPTSMRNISFVAGLNRTGARGALQPGGSTQCRRFIGLLVCAHIAAQYELRPRTASRAMRGGLTALQLRAAQQPCPYLGLRSHHWRDMNCARRPKTALSRGGLYSPAAARSAAALSVFSQVNSGSSRPKWPYAAVFS